MSGTRELCRDFRKNPTKAEQLLWEYLRAYRLSGIKFRRQYPIEGYIVDFYCSKAKLAIEVDGAIHLDKEQIEYDRQRETTLAENDIDMIRFWNEEVMNHIGDVEERIVSKIKQRIADRKKAKDRD